MVIDFDKVLASLKTYHRVPSKQIATPERVTALAEAMASRGYVHTVESLAALADWMNGYGILLSGNVGVGKTYFFKTLTRDVPIILSMREAFLWEYNDLDQWLNATMNRDIVVDDLGAEQRSRKFGEPYWLISLVLERRLMSGWRTNFTTNFTSDELAKKYEDASIVDRLYEIAKGHRLKTESSRREAHPRLRALEKMETGV